MRSMALCSKRQFYTLLLSFVCLLPLFASAHGPGLTLARESGDFYIDIDIANPLPETNSSTPITFNLFSDKELTESIEFDDVFVRVLMAPEGRQKTFFSGRIINDPIFGSGMRMIFPEPGEYTMTVTYDKKDAAGDNQELATESFQFSVTDKSSKFSFMDRKFIFGILAGAVGLLLVLLVILGILLRIGFLQPAPKNSVE